MVLWSFLACTGTVEEPLSTAIVSDVDVDGPSVGTWQWYSHSDPPYEVLLPADPVVQAATPDLDWGEGTASVPGIESRLRVFSTAFLLFRGAWPPSAPKSEPAPMLRGLAHARGAALGTISASAPWSGRGIDPGHHVDIETGRGGGAAVRVGIEGDGLWVLQITGDREGIVARTLSSFTAGVSAPMSPLLDGIAVSCPSRCAGFTEQLDIGAIVMPQSGVRGSLDGHGFEAVSVIVPPDGAADAVEALRRRGTRLARGRIFSEATTPAGRFLELQTGKQGRTWIRLAVIDGIAYQWRVVSPTEVPPPWAEAFVASPLGGGDNATPSPMPEP